MQITSGSNLSKAGTAKLQKRLPFLKSFNVFKSKDVKHLTVGEYAPAFALQTFDGKEIKLKDYHGKVVLLYFWATWCSPCVASTPRVKQLYEELSHNDKFEMISLSLDSDRQEFGFRRHIEQYGLNWPQILIGLDSQLAADYGVRPIPAYILIGPDGKVIFTDSDWNKLKTAIRIILNK